ncbi:hypothetical protein TKK_0007826 [Trichogramma kaykai]|uniref:Uncharacterized protein n=1 Tax=Trichogramma kaykai TaxID=54128 RepID=A0ABD2X7K2_9HYME
MFNKVLAEIPVNGKLLTFRLHGGQLQFLVGYCVIDAYDGYERCHVERWENEAGETWAVEAGVDAPICEKCLCPVDTPGDLVYGPSLV